MYILATGGNPGATGTNTELALMAALGSCSSLSSITSININEVTTVAAVTALQLGVSTSGGSPVITPLTGNSGLQHTETNSKFGTSRQPAIDGSSNVWVSNNPSGGIPYLTVVVGVAAPVVTPLSVALKNNRVGQRP